MTGQDVSGGTIKSTQTMFSIVDALSKGDNSRVTDIATNLNLAKSTVHRHLKTLERCGYVVKEDDEYRIGLRFLELGEYARNRKDLYQMVRPHLKQLAEETGERSLFMVEEHGKAIYLYRYKGDRAVRTDSHAGSRRPIHAVAGGKAILAFLPEEKVEDIIESKGLVACTPNTITSKDELYDELERTRERGYALNCEECISRLKAVAVPVLGRNETVHGAISLSGPTHRMKGEWFEKTIPDLLLGTANELEINLEYSV